MSVPALTVARFPCKKSQVTAGHGLKVRVRMSHLPQHLPHYFNSEAPRLKERGLLARAAFCSLAVACCGGVFVFAGLLFQFFVDIRPPTPNLHPTFVSVNGNAIHHSRKPIQRSIIQRLAILKRGPSGRGIDHDFAQRLFPTWYSASAVPRGTESEHPNLNHEIVLEDLVIALSYLSAAEIDD